MAKHDKGELIPFPSKDEIPELSPDEADQMIRNVLGWTLMGIVTGDKRVTPNLVHQVVAVTKNLIRVQQGGHHIILDMK
jgi:hypothetical protein